MSLRVWLPLNGDLHNQGCSNASVTNTSATVNTTGKIGSCYSFGTSKSYLKFDNMNFIHNFTECSVSLWLKILSWNTSYATYFQFGLGSTPWAHYIFGLLRNSSASTLCFTISNGSSATNAGCLTPTLELNTWYHLTLTYTAGHCKIYVNGIQTNDYSTTIVPNFAGITTGTIGVSNNLTGYQTNCLINDFRIYDHCLSAAEVKEIAQGLVLHYKLDDITNGVQDSSGYGHNGTINGTMSTSSNTARYNSSIIFNGSDNAIKIPFNDIIKTDDYTVSVWTYKETIGTKNYQTILGGPSGFELEARSSSSTSPLYRIHNWGGGTTAYEFNKWNLFTFVRTANDSKLYVNGELKITGTAGTIPSGNYFIGAWNTATRQNYEGLMSDFRLYCIALSPDDILALYHTGAKIDNLQNTHTFEYIEDQSLIKVTKQGQIKCDEIIEDTNVKIKKDNTIEAIKFIEL